MTEPTHIISLGAGVQSSCMSLMAAHGEITPMPECAIFADTQAEPEEVYRWLGWLQNHLPFPVYVETKGDLYEKSLDLRTSRNGNAYTKHSVPAFVADADNKIGLMKRQCTEDFKIVIVQRKIREIRTKLKASVVVQWMGISVDEADRMKPVTVRRKINTVIRQTEFLKTGNGQEYERVQHPYITNRWPLIEMGVSRTDCLAWMESRGYPEPPRSACIMCPYRSNRGWLKMKTESPKEFERAAQYEDRLKITMKSVVNFRGTPYLHRLCQPLREIEFEKLAVEASSQFSNECEGMCGV